MHIIFPNCTKDGITLLLLRKRLVDWTVRTTIGHGSRVENGEFQVTLDQEQHYTQFVLQWEDTDFYIVQ